MRYQRRLTTGCFLALILLLTTQCGQTTSQSPSAEPTDAPVAASTDAASTEAASTDAASAEAASTEAASTEAASTEASAEAAASPATETASSAATGSVAAPELTWQGTITVFSQAYTPNSTLPNADQLVAFQSIADEYQQLHPGITIQFIDEEILEYDTVLRTKAAAGELWDIFWAQWGNLNGNYPEGIAVDLTPYLDQPNPYIPGNAKLGRRDERDRAQRNHRP